MKDQKANASPTTARPSGTKRSGYALTTTEIVAQAAFTLVVVLRLWKGWDVTLRVVMPFLATAIYLIPTFFAFERPHPRRLAVVAVNILLGWTLIGWLTSLAMALKPMETRADPLPPPMA